MTRRIRIFAIALVTSLALSAAACGNLTAPDRDACTDQESDSCAQLTIHGSNT